MLEVRCPRESKTLNVCAWAVCVCSVGADRALPKNNLDDVLRKVSPLASEFIYSVPQHHPYAFENLCTQSQRYDPCLCRIAPQAT